MTSVFNQYLQSPDPTDQAWAQAKLKTPTLSDIEMSALGTAIQAVWKGFSKEEGILRSSSFPIRVCVYTPMRYRTYLVPFMFWFARWRVKAAIERFMVSRDGYTRGVKIEHQFHVDMKQWNRPLKPVENVDLAREIEIFYGPLSFGERVRRVVARLKQVV